MGPLFSSHSGGTRAPAVAGMFYPGSPSELSSMIDDFLAHAEKLPATGKPLALIVPHAGYVYSGQVAANAYKQIQGEQFDTVVVVGVSHRTAIKGASVYRAGQYETPLGSVEIDSTLSEELMAKSDLFTFQPRSHALEHSVEVQVPFLQRVLSEFKIVPVLMGYWSEPVCSEVGRALAELIRGRNILLVASTDMSHYHPYDVARAMDHAALSSIERMDIAKLVNDLSSGKCELCGAGPVLSTLTAVRELGAGKVKILQYANSGDVTGNRFGEVVGYFAAAIYP